MTSYPGWVPAPIWLAYRRARRLSYTLVGRNPLRVRAAPLSWRQELRSVRGLLRALTDPPYILKREDGRVLWRTVLGPMWTPPGAGPNYVGRLAAEMLANVYDLGTLRRRTSGPVVLDCGANVGFFTRLALQSGAAHVVAFEPSPGNLVCLRQNLETEIETGKVTIIEKGVWDSDAILSFSSSNKANPGAHHISVDGMGDSQIPVTAIDVVCERLNLTRVDYLKLDVEGSEVVAIRGAARVIRESHPVLCVATEHTDDVFANAVAVLETMREIDPSYRCVCTEAHIYSSPSRGSVLTPYSLLFC
jgi:FkbM family methyltransferase